MKKILIRLVISILIAALFVWWFKSQGLRLIPSWTEIKTHVEWWTLPAYVGIIFVFHIIRAWRWVYLLKPVASVRKRSMMPVAFIGFMAIMVMPLRTGEFVRPYLINRRAGVSKSAAFGTIAIERVIDGLLVSLWLSACLVGVESAKSPYVWSLRILPLALFTSALIVLIVFLANKEWFKKVVGGIMGFFSGRIRDGVLGVLDRFWTGLQALPNRRYVAMFVLLSIVYWGLNACGFWVLAKGTGLDIPFLGAVAGMAVVAVGILLPAGPGFFGNFQVATLLALSFYLPDEVLRQEGATIFIFLLYVLQSGWAILFGLISLVIERIPLDRILRPFSDETILDE